MTLVTLRGAPAGNGLVDVWQIGEGGAHAQAVDLAGNVVRLPRAARANLDAAGVATVELLPTGALTPAGSVYRAEFRGAGGVADLVFGGFAGIGPVEAVAYRVPVPGTLTVIQSGGGPGDVASLIEQGGGP